MGCNCTGKREVRCAACGGPATVMRRGFSMYADCPRCSALGNATATATVSAAPAAAPAFPTKKVIGAGVAVWAITGVLDGLLKKKRG